MHYLNSLSYRQHSPEEKSYQVTQMKKPAAHTLKSVLPWIDLPSSISGKAKEEEKEAQPL